MGILFSNLLLKQIFDFESGQTENTQIRVSAYFQFDNSLSQKLIPKADLKRECPYFNSIFFLKSFGQYFKKVKK